MMSAVFFGAAIGSAVAVLLMQGAMMAMGWHCDRLERDPIQIDDKWQVRVDTIAKFIEWFFKPEYQTKGACVLGFLAGMMFSAVMSAFIEWVAK